MYIHVCRQLLHLTNFNSEEIEFNASNGKCSKHVYINILLCLAWISAHSIWYSSMYGKAVISNLYKKLPCLPYTCISISGFLGQQFIICVVINIHVWSSLLQLTSLLYTYSLSCQGLIVNRNVTGTALDTGWSVNVWTSVLL